MSADSLETMVTLREPREDELSELSALCIRSKAVWGYDDAFMAACVDELTFHPGDLTATHLQIAEDDKGTIGLAQIAMVDDNTATIEALFMEPDRIGSGAGRILFNWIVETAQTLGAKTLMIESDPDAAPFYRHMGAVDAGEVPSGSISGRMLPLLRLDL